MDPSGNSCVCEKRDYVVTESNNDPEISSLICKSDQIILNPEYENFILHLFYSYLNQK